MKRALSSVIFAGATIFAFGQGSFTIVRPFDGSKVREMVKVLFPKNSVPDQTGYVGIFIDGDFIEAVAPKLSADKKFYEYTLDTKALADGTHKLEAKLYVDYSNQPRIVDTSSVDITVANKSSIAVPEDGFKLRYKFAPGSERIYRMQHKTIINAISEEDQKKQGSRPFQIQEEGESLKLLYAVDNAYGNGDGLVRLQIVPDKGIKNREFSYVTTAGASGPERFYPENMAGIYMRITSTGREVFGSIPDYFGLEGNVGAGQRLALYAAFPLPTLPSKGVKPGDSWGSNIQRGALDLEKRDTVNSVVSIVPARGEFLGVEWEMGHPCAKIKNSIAQGTPVKKAGSKTENISDQKVSIEETIWFALDTGVVVKFFRDQTVEGKADFGILTGQSGNGGQSGPAGNPGPGQGRGGSRGGGKDGPNPNDFRKSSANLKFQSAGGGMLPPPGSGPAQGGGGGFGPGGGQGGGTPAFVRVRSQELFVLEK